jgi:2-keto-4-pentenoate hydratase
MTDLPASLREEEVGRRAAAHLQASLAAEGVNVAGIKLGAHDCRGREALGLSGTLVAPFFDAWTFPSGTRVLLARFVQPKLECEIGFRRVGGRWQPSACIEVADSRLEWTGRGGQVLADFALNGAMIAGSSLARSDSVAFELRHDGALVLSDVASVATALERTEACTGDSDAAYVSSGALHPLLELTAGQWTLEFAGGGEAMLTVEAGTDDDQGGT